MSQPPANPFSTRFIRPGQLAYRFESGDSLQQLVERLKSYDWWGEIVGPHGSGKSTLLQHLLPQLEAAGRSLHLATLHGGESKLPGALIRDVASSPHPQVVIDGYEQLSWWRRLRCTRRLRILRAGLLVTSHKPVGLPLLLETSPRLEAFQNVVSELLRNSPLRFNDDEVQAAFRQHNGNVREALFTLYDLYERRRV